MQKYRIDRALEELAKPNPDLARVASILRGDEGQRIEIKISGDTSGFEGGIRKIIDQINEARS